MICQDTGWSQVFEFSCLSLPHVPISAREVVHHGAQSLQSTWCLQMPLLIQQEPKVASLASSHPSLWLPIRVIQGCLGVGGMYSVKVPPQTIETKLLQVGPRHLYFPLSSQVVLMPPGWENQAHLPTCAE